MDSFLHRNELQENKTLYYRLEHSLNHQHQDRIPRALSAAVYFAAFF